MKRFIVLLSMVVAAVLIECGAVGQGKKDQVPLKVNPPHISTAASVKYDFDIVYVRAPRMGDGKQIAWTEVFNPLRAEPGSDLMLLHPDGREEVLVAAGADAINEPLSCVYGPFASPRTVMINSRKPRSST